MTWESQGKNITVQLSWVPIGEGRILRLACKVYIIPVTTSDYWMVRVDATGSNILEWIIIRVYCNCGCPSPGSF
jgi:hypothetical protein